MKQNSYVMYECLYMNIVVRTSNSSKLKRVLSCWIASLLLKERSQMGDQGVAREAVLKGILDRLIVGARQEVALTNDFLS
jgi:hypothetical protein